MKVICIDDKMEGPAQADFILKYGESYEVIQTFQSVRPEWVWYELSIQPKVGYAVERFIPLSEINETEFERNYIKEKV